MLKKIFATWLRTPGKAVDVWEAHAALVHLQDITEEDQAAGRGPETARWLQANANVAECMSYISARQEIQVRDAVARNELPPEVAELLGRPTDG